MKKLFFLFALLLSVLAVACQNQETIQEEGKLEMIAQNAVYQAYLKAEREIQLNINQRSFDLKAIHKIWRKNPTAYICDFADSELVNLKGGLLYKKLHCEAQQQAEKLKIEIPSYLNLTPDDVVKVSKIHDEIFDINWEKELEEARSNHPKN